MIALVITALVAIEAIGIMFVEVFGSTPQQVKAFELEPEIVDIPEVKTLLGNQGVYNGLLGVLIFATMFLLSGHAQVVMLALEMGFILIAAIYGSLTAVRKIILVQGLPAAIALLALFMK